MIHFFDDVPAALGSLAALLENLLFPLLLLEVFWFWRTKQLGKPKAKEMQFSEIRKLGQDLRDDRLWATRLRRLWEQPGWQPTTPVSNALETAEVGS